MKRWTCLALILCLLLALFGCSNSSAQMDAPITTGVDIINEPEATSSVESDKQENGFPFLLGILQEDNRVQMDLLTWDVAKGQLLEATPWYSLICSSVLDVLISHWDGSTTVHLLAEAEPIAAEIHTKKPEVTMIPYGRCAYVQKEGKLYQIDSAGVLQELPLPRDPGDVYDAAKLPIEPYYATVDGDVGIAAFFVYDDVTVEGDVVYCTYPLSAPEQAVWNCVHIPLAYAMDTRIQSNGAYSNGTLYLAAMQAILAIDVETGELHVLDASNAFAAVRALHPDATQSDGSYEEPIVISGCWKNTLLADFPLFLPDGTCYYYFVALQDGEVAGIMERQENGVLTFYDGNGQVIGANDCYQDKIAPLSIQFPRDD